MRFLIASALLGFAAACYDNDQLLSCDKDLTGCINEDASKVCECYSAYSNCLRLAFQDHTCPTGTIEQLCGSLRKSAENLKCELDCEDPTTPAEPAEGVTYPLEGDDRELDEYDYSGLNDCSVDEETLTQAESCASDYGSCGQSCACRSAYSTCLFGVRAVACDWSLVDALCLDLQPALNSTACPFLCEARNGTFGPVMAGSMEGTLDGLAGGVMDGLSGLETTPPPPFVETAAETAEYGEDTVPMGGDGHVHIAGHSPDHDDHGGAELYTDEIAQCLDTEKLDACQEAMSECESSGGEKCDCQKASHACVKRVFAESSCSSTAWEEFCVHSTAVDDVVDLGAPSAKEVRCELPCAALPAASNNNVLIVTGGAAGGTAGLATLFASAVLWALH